MIEIIIVHVFDQKTYSLLNIYFIYKVTGNKVDYSVKEFKESTKQ